MQACPYDALYIDPHDNTAQKCNYCAHRVDVGLEPACVIVCPEQAIIAGDLDNPVSKIAKTVSTEHLVVRAPEQGTGPNVFYKGVEAANLDPATSGALTDSGVWRDAKATGDSWLSVDLTPPTPSTPIGRFEEDRQVTNPVTSSPAPNSPPRVVYNTDHPAPWGWKVSAYFLTKGVAAGIALAAAIALAAGVGADSDWMRWIAPLVAGGFTLLTGLLLVWDLKKPGRFLFILTKSNSTSWLVRGAWILGAFAALLGLWFILGIANVGFLAPIIWLTAITGLGVAGYTAFLFGQAEGRDLWQSPQLLWHMIGGALVVGAGASLLAITILGEPEQATNAFAATMLIGAVIVGLMSANEFFGSHITTNAEAAAHHMMRGEFAAEWWLGQVLVVLAPILASLLVLAGWSAPMGAIGGLAGWLGVFLADNAFVKAGQSVPLS